MGISEADFLSGVSEMDPPQLTTDDVFPPTKWAFPSRGLDSRWSGIQAVPFFTVAQDAAGEVLKKWETTRGVTFLLRKVGLDRNPW